MPYVKSGTPQKDYGGPGVVDVYHSSNVFANFVPVALWNDPQGPEAAIANAIASPTFAVDSSTIVFDGDDNSTMVNIEQQRLIKEGVITQAELDAGKNATPSTFDPTTVSVNTGTIEGTVTLATKVDDTLLYQSPSNDTGITYYVKTVTKQPDVIFPYDVATIAPQNGVSVQEVCDNLRLLILNCFDLIKKQYPDAFMTNSFRSKSTNSTSQHPRGMACDIQYSKATKAEYYTRALWIRDNIAFDQFILEYKTTGSKQPWHHISFNKNGNRSQIFTFLNDKNFKGPGIQGLYNLTNV